MGLGDLRSRKEELEKAAAFHAAQHDLHASEAAKHAREMEYTRVRLDEINRLLSPRAAEKQHSRQEASGSDGATTSRLSGRQRYRSEGPTTVIVRLLYENTQGMTSYEMQARNGIAIKSEMIRKIVERLLKVGHARREGQKMVLTEQGIKLWEASPLFLRSQRNGTSRASQN
jgi:predicted transcriptional regulator